MQPITPGSVATPLALPRSDLHPVVAFVVWTLALGCPAAIIVMSLLMADAISVSDDSWAVPLYGLIVASWGRHGRIPGHPEAR